MKSKGTNKNSFKKSTILVNKDDEINPISKEDLNELLCSA